MVMKVSTSSVAAVSLKFSSIGHLRAVVDMVVLVFSALAFVPWGDGARVSPCCPTGGGGGRYFWVTPLILGTSSLPKLFAP